MKKRKIILTVMIVITLMLSALCFVACGGDSSGTNNGNGDNDIQEYEGLRYTAIKENNEVIGYGVSKASSNKESTISIPSVYNNLPVLKINNSGFNNSKNLTNVVIPDSVTDIGNSAFGDCKNLKNLTIGSSVTSVGMNAFSCPELNGVYYTGTLETWCGIAFASGSSNPLLNAHNLYINNELVTELAIPDLVTVVKNYAFCGLSSLTSIEIHDSVTNIGISAFQYCRSLTSVNIPSSVISIGSYAFGSCSSLESVTIPSDGVSIGDMAFIGCDSVKYAEIPTNAISHISQDNLQTVVINGGDTWWSFSSCSSLINVEIGNSVTTIKNMAFWNCSNLTSIKIPSSVTKIGESAFRQCSSLRDVYYAGDLSDWCGIQFDAASSNPLCYAQNLYIDNELVTELALPDNVTEINDYAFDGYSSLTNVEIPNSVIRIGSYAFSGCSNISSVHIDDLSSWCGITFENFYANPLSVAYNSSAVARYLYISGELSTELVIPDTVTEINDYAFHAYSGLESIEIPSSVTSIGQEAFYECTGLTSIEIPSSVTSIGNKAFYKCTGLTDIEISGSVENIGRDAFYYCNDIVTASIPMAANSYISKTKLQTLVINGGKSINDRAFRDCSSLTSVVIGDSITYIGNEAFRNCQNLTSVTISKSVKSIAGLIDIVGKGHEYAPFYECTNLNSVYYTGDIEDWFGIIFKNDYSANPLFFGHNLYIKDELVTEVTVPDSVLDIPAYVFAGCRSLKNIEFTDRVRSIAVGAFAFCGLTSIEIPNNITSIDYYAFRGCISIVSATIPTVAITYIPQNSLQNVVINGGESIANGGFRDCSTLSIVTICDSVKSIGNTAFDGCSNLSIITIADGLESIGFYAFRGCSNLSRIQIPKSVTDISEGAFSECSILTIYCEAASKPTGWSAKWNSDKRPVVWNCKNK